MMTIIEQIFCNPRQLQMKLFLDMLSRNNYCESFNNPVFVHDERFNITKMSMKKDSKLTEQNACVNFPKSPVQ